MSAPAAQSLASSRSGSHSSLVLWKLFCCRLIKWIVNSCWTLHFRIWAGGPMDWANWSPSCTVYWISPSARLKASWRGQNYLLYLLPSPYPLDRKTIVGTLHQGHKLSSKILLLTSRIAALPTALQTCTSSGLAPAVGWLGGPPRSRTCGKGLLATSRNRNAKGGDWDGEWKKEKRGDHHSLSLPDEFGLDPGLDQRHL